MMNKIQRLSISLMTLLMATSSWAYKVTINPAVSPVSGDPSITASRSSETITSSTDVLAGTTVTLTVGTSDTRYLTKFTVNAFADAGDATARRRAIQIVGKIDVREVTEYQVYEFTMPNSDVTITPEFADRIDISGATITLSGDFATGTREYDWIEHKPVISSVKKGETTLTEGTDYTVTGLNTVKDVSNNTITLTGVGKYKGTATKIYKIEARNISTATVQFSPTSFVYNHQDQAPLASTVAVYLMGQKLLLDTDYDNVSIPTDSENKGSYDVSVTGIGNFTGTAKGAYTITQMPISNCTFTGNTSFVYNGEVQTPSITVNDGVGNLTENTDYTISYSNSSSKEVGTYTMTFTAKDGTNYTGSKEITYSINSAGFAITAIADQTYTGADIEPTIEVKDNINILTKGTHYTVVFSNNKNVGIAKVTVVGINSYNGKLSETTFNIVAKSLNAQTTSGTDDISIELSQFSFTYNASTQKPTVTVKDRGTLLVENRDYTLENAGGVNVGTTYYATITGLGNYKDSNTSVNYSITALSLTGAEITLETNSVTYNGAAQTPAVRQVKIDNVVIPSTDYDVEWSNNEVAAAYNDTPAPTVTVKAKTSGTINLSGNATTTFTIAKKSIANVEITISPESFTYINGVNQKPTTVTVKDAERNVNLTEETDYSLTNNGGIAAGTYDVTVTGIGNYKDTAKKYYVINEKAGSTAIQIADIADQTYTGDLITPTPAVTYKYDDSHTATLTKDTHYTLSYNNNVNVGTATVIVTLKGGYTGSATKTFKIVQKSLAGATVTPSTTSLVYNGNVQKPTFTVIKDGKTLAAGVDYDVAFTGDATSAGTQTVTISGIGNYTGTQDGSYSIGKLSLGTATITLPAERFEYNRNPQTPVPVVSVGSLVISSGNYSITYKDDDNTSSTEDLTNKGIKTITITGQNNCESSKSTTYEIVAKPLLPTMVSLAGEVTYTGSALTPTVTVNDGVGNLTLNTDFTVTYDNNINVGTATVTVTGQGNYTGVIQKTFNIQTNVHSAFTIGDIDAVVYNGSEHKPTPTVQYSETDLTLNKDYTLSYSNNINAGTATVIVTGKGGYEGSSGTKTFTIQPKPLDADKVTLSFTSITFTGMELKPAVTVLDGSTKLAENTDFTVTYPADVINQGVKTVTIEGIRNYTTVSGTATSIAKTYTIDQVDISNAEVNLSYTNIVFKNGVEQKPEVRTVYANGHQLTSTTDYTVSWPGTDYTNQGVKTVRVTGTGNYKNSRDVTYTIDRKDVTDDMISFGGDGYDATNNWFIYDANNHTPTVTVKDDNITLNQGTATAPQDYLLTNATGNAVGNYEVKIEGQGNYKGEAKKRYSIVTAGSTGFDVAAIADQNYTGMAIKPTITVYKAGTTSPALIENTDYRLDITNNVNAGTATVNVTGMGNYSGVQTVYFNIVPKSLNATGITVKLTPESFSYTGTTQKPEVTVKDGTTKTLVLNTDYTLVNDGGIANGTYNVTITGIGNYKDEISPAPSYTIGDQTLNGAMVILNLLDSYIYDGSEKKPGVSEVKIGSSVIPASNYDVSYSNNINAGTATVTVTGKGNCSGTATTTFVIAPKTVNSDMITLSETSFNYDGNLHKPTTVTVMDGGTLMYEGDDTTPKDYKLTNNGGTAIGSYGVTITGQKNYTGTASKSFSIVANDASGFTVEAIDDQTYDGTAKEPAPVVKEGATTLATDYYSVAYLNNVNAGTAVVTVTGKNGYTFVKSQTFTIKPKALAADMLTLSSASFIFNGSVQKPTVTMTDNGTTGSPIITSNDYVVINEGGTNVGSYNVVVNGQNNYTGSISKSFNITELSISPGSIILATLASYVYEGGEKKPAVQLVKVGELVVPSTAYDVAYSNNINYGSATVTVKAKTGTNFTGSCSTNFAIEQKPVTSDMIILSSENLIYTGSNQKPSVTVKNGDTTLTLGTDYTVDNPGGKDVGNYWVTVTGMGNYKGSATKQFSIVAENSAAFDVSGVSAQETYSGLPIEPEVTVWTTDHGATLTKGKDYEVTYSDNVNAGTATVTVTGMGNYGGTRRVTFTIVPKDLVADEIQLSQTSFKFNGTEQRPIVTVTDGAKTLKENTDFTVDYPVDTKSQGTKTLTITGIGNYKGTETRTYTIGSLTIANATVTLTYTNTVYNGTAQKPAVQTVYANGLQLTEGVDYTVTYPTDADATNQGTKTITINGIGNYSETKAVTYQIAPKPVTSSMITLSSENLVYTGETIKPDVTVRDGNVTLIVTTDYTLTNAGGKDYGTYNVVITGQGNYTGEAIKTYSIVRKDVSDFTVSAIADMTYDGTAKQPLPEVKDHMNKVMVKGTDYLISYLNNTNVGTATATVTGINSYSGTKSVEFVILPKSLTVTDGSIEITLSKTALPYTGNIQRPEVMVKDGTKTLVQNTDYTLINDGGVSNGSYEVKITGIGNYKDVVTKTYTIGKTSLEGATVILNRLDSYVYDGIAKTPSVSEVKVEASYISPANYTVSYSNNVNVGTAVVTVTATEAGNCTGSATATFNITPKTVNSEMITFTPVMFSYDGELHKPETVTVSDGTRAMTQGTDYTLTNEGGTALGTYSVTITGMGNYAGSASKTYNIVANDGSDFVVEGIGACVYTGSAQTPVPVVKDGEKVLDPEYYTVSYSNNVNAGTGVVTVSGKNGYTFVKSVSFTISPSSLSESMMTLSETNFIYNGNLQKPEVSMSGLASNDYVLSNEGGINVGTYRVVATGQGNYTGTIEKSYTIGLVNLADAVITLGSLANAIYDGNAKTPSVVDVKVGTVSVSADNYTVSYENNIHAGTATVTVTAKEPSNCTGTATTTFTIMPKTVTSDMIEISPSFLNYDGTLQKPSLVTVKDGVLSMTKDKDYTLTNEGGTAVGTYNVTITGKGDYTGTASKSYSIVANDASGFSIDAIDDHIFDGTAKTPAPVVKDENGNVIPTDGYNVSYLNNINAGTAFVTVSGKNGYTFIKSQMFTILPKQLTDDMVSLSATEFNYNGSIQRPVVTVSDGGTGEASLITSNDYVLINEGGADIGTYQVIVKGQNNYTGSVTKSYSIGLLSLSDATVTLATSSFVYDGTAKEPPVQLVNVGQVIVSPSDYSVSYNNNVNVGTATVTITGKGNYSGSKTVTFEITPKTLTDDMITLTPSSVVYNEKLQKPVVMVMDGQTVLKEDVDYRLTNTGGTDPGQYTVSVTGIGNYTGTILATFTIESPDMVAEIDGMDEKGHPTTGSASIRPTDEEGNEAEIVSYNNSSIPGQLPISSITIPATTTSGGKTYAITSIADGAFANMSDLKDVYLPETESPMTLGENVFPDGVMIHVPLALLDDYALMPALERFFKEGKVLTTVKVSNRFWTFSSGVDVVVPDNVSVYVVHERNDNTVSIIELTDEELTVAGQRIIKANNGVLFECKGFASDYDVVASGVRMSSGTAISTDDHKDYGQENRLEPVIESKHYESGNYYFLKNNEFYHVKTESESLKVPAGKAVLHLSQQATTRSYSDILGLVGPDGRIESEDDFDVESEDLWYDMNGRKLEGTPTRKGVYIRNNRKIVIK